MNQFTRIFLLLITFSMITACTLNPRVQANHDDGLVLSDYQTYNFSSRTEIEKPDQSEELELYFTAAVEKQLLTQGLVRSDTPDVLINVSVDLEDKSAPPIKGNNCPRYVDYYSQNRADNYDGAGRRPMCIYKEGSIKIDMVNTELNRTIFAGVSRLRLDEKDRGRRLALYAVADVATMFGDSSAQIAMVSP